MSVNTRSQKLAQAAFRCIANRNGGKPTDDYRTLAKKFPALIHTCGLAQAVAFAEAKGKIKDEKKPQKPEILYLEDLATVLSQCGHGEINSPGRLAQQTREEPLSSYLRLSRDAINAAGWLKRYVEAAGGDE